MAIWGIFLTKTEAPASVFVRNIHNIRHENIWILSDQKQCLEIGRIRIRKKFSKKIRIRIRKIFRDPRNPGDHFEKSPLFGDQNPRHPLQFEPWL